MNLNNQSRHEYLSNDSRAKQVLKAKGIEQAWQRRRRHSSLIYSGVRVKISREKSFCIESIHHQSKSIFSEPTDRAASMLKRLWIESETSALTQNGQKVADMVNNPLKNKLLTSQQTNVIGNNSVLGKNQSFTRCPKNKATNSIGIQTMVIPKLDQQTSCDIVISASKITPRNHKQQSSSSSSTSASETSISDENSSHTNDTSVVSSTASDTRKNADHSVRHQRNKNRNNNAIDHDDEQKWKQSKIEEFITEKTKTQLPNTKSSLQDISMNKQYYSQSILSPAPSAEKRRLFTRLLNLFSFLRLSSFRRDRACILTSNITTTMPTDNEDRNEGDKSTRPPASRCRRSTARNCNYRSSILSKKNYFTINVEQKASVQSVGNISPIVRKPSRPVNSSNLSTADSDTNLRKTLLRRSNKTNARKRSRRKSQNLAKRHRHRKKSKSSPLSHSQVSLPAVPVDNIQPLSSVEENRKLTVDNTNHSDDTYPKVDEEIELTSSSNPDMEINSLQKTIIPLQQNRKQSSKCAGNLSLRLVTCPVINSVTKSTTSSSPPFHIKQNDCEQFSSIDSIRLRVKNKNLISTLSKSKIASSSHLDSSIQIHQRNIINEFKSLLHQQTKHIHINNNSLDDHNPPVVTPSSRVKPHVKQMSKPSVELTKNQNENRHQRASLSSSDRPLTSMENKSPDIQQVTQGQNEIIRDGVDQLIRYQKFAQGYELKSNQAVRQFLLKSNVLSSDSLYKLSLTHEPQSTRKTKLNFSSKDMMFG